MTATLGTQWNTMHSFFIHLTAKSTHHQDVVTILCVTEPDWSGWAQLGCCSFFGFSSTFGKAGLKLCTSSGREATVQQCHNSTNGDEPFQIAELKRLCFGVCFFLAPVEKYFFSWKNKYPKNSSCALSHGRCHHGWWLCIHWDGLWGRAWSTVGVVVQSDQMWDSTKTLTNGVYISLETLFGISFWWESWKRRRKWGDEGVKPAHPFGFQKC